ncbi:putative membrane protein [Gluconacetobacter diazotrophicus PA1 5]|nr:putative membrane protein [Gluconacetobacter diazotrophicus PA1 5]
MALAAAVARMAQPGPGLHRRAADGGVAGAAVGGPAAMTEKSKAEKAEAARQERLAREAAALRENLRRRKQQSRARADAPAAPPVPDAAAEDGAKS